jgi:hypothetical protein
MSNPAPHVSQTRTGTSKSKANVNPTSTGKTIYQYAINAILAANYLLHNHPRHVQYRKTQGKSRKSVLDARHFSNPFYEDLPRPPSPPTPSPRHERTVRHEKVVGRHKHAQTSIDPYSQDRYRDNSHYRARSEAHSAACREPSPSKAQRSEAWTRIRSVSSSKPVLQ